MVLYDENIISLHNSSEVNMDIRQMIALGILGGTNPFAYRALWLHTIHVSTTGSDSAPGDGTLAHPYLTLTKALTVAVSGDGILFANGTYGSGVNYTTITKTYTSYVTIEPELGAAGDVTYTSNAIYATTIWMQNGNAYLKFKYIKFLGTNNSANAMRFSNAIDHVDFENCSFIGSSVDLSGGAGLYFNPSTYTNVVFNNCTFTGECGILSDGMGGDGSCSCSFNGCTFNGKSTGGSAYGVNWAANAAACPFIFSNCYATGSSAFYLHGGTYTITNLQAIGMGTLTACMIGVDGDSASPSTTATVSGLTVTKNAALGGHGLEVGAGSLNCVIDGFSISASYDYTLVMKEGTNNELKNGTIGAGPIASVYYKGSTAPNVHNCTINVGGSGIAFQLLKNLGSGHKVSNYGFTSNVVHSLGSSTIFGIGTVAADDAGGGVCDYNQYDVHGSGKYGLIHTTSGIQNLSALQAAWAGYGDGSNDSHSVAI